RDVADLFGDQRARSTDLADHRPLYDAPSPETRLVDLGGGGLQPPYGCGGYHHERGEREDREVLAPEAESFGLRNVHSGPIVQECLTSEVRRTGAAPDAHSVDGGGEELARERPVGR